MRRKSTIGPFQISAHPDIEKVRLRLQSWRKARHHGARIPEDLWIAAAMLARAHRPGTVAHALGLDYYTLKDRVKSASATVCRKERTGPAFVELMPPAPTCLSECTLEIEDRHGSKMRIHLRSSETPDLGAISSAFLRARA
jgi:hypothetical protein